MATDIKNSIPFLEGLNNTNGDAPQWLRDIRQKSLSRFTEVGVPTIKDEEWKYTNVTPIVERKYSLPKKADSIKNATFDRYYDVNELNLVFINGIFSPEYSTIKGLPKGVYVATLKTALKERTAEVEDLFKQYEVKNLTTFASLNQALAEDGVYIKVDNNVVFEKLIHIIHLTHGKGPEILSASRTLISMSKSSEATVLESHVAFTDDLVYFANPLTDIFLSENAVLHYSKIQSESKKAFHIGITRVSQEQNSNFDGFTLAVGSQINRNNLDVTLNGEGINSTLNGLYCVNDTQLVDNHSTVDHRQPNCASNQLYKGILNGASRAVFNGKIFVRPIAQKTNSYQLNKNLILGKDARVDTKPQLEIGADDVKCTHGATIGQLNEDELFYLQTRCIPKKKAVSMLSHGFVDDILQKISSESVHQKMDILLEPTFAALE